jgi:hypothetical protein
MNDTLANLTVEAANSTFSPTNAANETAGHAINQAGNFGVDKLLNLSWTDGVAGWLNLTFNTTAFSGQIIAALLPIITLLFLYWKWNAVVSFFQTAGQVVIILLVIFLGLKAFGML